MASNMILLLPSAVHLSPPPLVHDARLKKVPQVDVVALQLRIARSIHILVHQQVSSLSLSVACSQALSYLNFAMLVAMNGGASFVIVTARVVRPDGCHSVANDVRNQLSHNDTAVWRHRR